MRRLLVVLTWCLLAAYPVIVYFGLQSLRPGVLGIFFLAIAALRFILFRNRTTNNPIPVLLSVLLALVALHALLAGNDHGLMYYPVVVNATLLSVFTYSLFQNQTIIERVARISNPELPAAAIAYTRKITVVWSVFFLLNGAAALYTVLYASRETWTLYNGFIAYLLIALLFGVELWVRRYFQKSVDA